MISEDVEYKCDDTQLKGHLVYQADVPAKRPAVIVAHTWRGLDEFARQKARNLAELGYIGFAADLYGQGKAAANDEEALQLMLPLFLNRRLLQERLKVAVDLLRKHPMVDPSEIGAIGFCFGGLAVIELLRSGTDISGAVSFHATLGRKMEGQAAALEPIANKIEGSLLILQGHDDPFVKAEDVQYIQNELSKAKVDWQMHIYGNTVHAFTNPKVHDIKSGLAFDAKANMRSWQAMCNFFDEIFP